MTCVKHLVNDLIQGPLFISYRNYLFYYRNYRNYRKSID